RGRLPARARSFPRGRTRESGRRPERRPVTSRGNRPVRARLFELLEEGLDGRRELSALADPVIDALAVDLDVGGVLLRVVVADLLHNRRARGLQRVGDDDAIERGMGRATTAQANLEHLIETPSFRARNSTGTGRRTAIPSPTIPAADPSSSSRTSSRRSLSRSSASSSSSAGIASAGG